jgi:hypothetical protein
MEGEASTKKPLSKGTVQKEIMARGEGGTQREFRVGEWIVVPLLTKCLAGLKRTARGVCTTSPSVKGILSIHHLVESMDANSSTIGGDLKKHCSHVSRGSNHPCNHA